MARTIYGFSNASTYTSAASVPNTASGKAVFLGLSAPTANSACAVFYRGTACAAGSEIGVLVVASPGNTVFFPFPFRSMQGIYVTASGGSAIVWTE